MLPEPAHGTESGPKLGEESWPAHFHVLFQGMTQEG